MSNHDHYNDEHLEGAENTAENTQQENTPVEEPSAEEKLAQEVETLKDKYIRLQAEFDNYRKRTAKERVELIQSASKDVITKLLPSIDDFDRALKAMESTTEVSAVKTGIELVANKFKQTLTQQGLKEMDILGQPFDADLEEAITSIPAPSEDLKNKIIDVIEKGYYLNDKVIRHAKVIIGQ